MLIKYCPNCNSQIKVNSEHVYLTICPHCKKCVKPMKDCLNIISTEESLKDIEPFFTDKQLKNLKLVRCPEWQKCNEHDCEHIKPHTKNDDCKLECFDNRDGNLISVTNKECC